MTVFELRKIFTALQGLLPGYVLVLRDSARLPSIETFAEESHAQAPAFIYCAVRSVHPRFRPDLYRAFMTSEANPEIARATL